MLLEDLRNVLSSLTSDLQGLITCLQDEKEAVVSYDLKKIKESYQQKLRQTQRIDHTEHKRKVVVEKLMAQAGLSSSMTPRISIDELLTKSFPGNHSILKEEIRDQLSCVRSLSQAAQEFNELQRQFLMYSLQDIHSSLYLLESLQGKEQFQGYDQQGELKEGNFANRPSAVDSNI